MRNNPFSSYRPGVAALGGGNFSADTKPKTGGAPPNTDPMEPTKPGGWVPEPGSGQKPITSAAGGKPWDANRIRSWWDRQRNLPMTNYGRRPDGSVNYSPAQYGSNYTGPRYGVNNLPTELIGNPNIWNSEWMSQYNDFRRGLGPDPRTQTSATRPVAIPGSGYGPPAPGGG